MINKYSILNGPKYFSLNVLQNYLVFISTNKYIEFYNMTQQMYSWKSQGMSDESIKNTGSDQTILDPSLTNHRPLPLAKFSGNCLRMSSISVHQKVVNLYISRIIDTWPRDLNTNFTLDNCLLGAVELTKNADPNKYLYNAFDTRSEFSLTDSSVGKNDIIFVADMGLSVDIDNKSKDILVLGELPTQGYIKNRR